MAPSSPATPGLSDEQLAELLRLVADADSVELKLTVAESEQYTAAAALGLDPLDAQIRQVFFFDTPDLALNREGVVVRARRVQGRHGDAIVKLRPIDRNELPDDVRDSPDLNVEVDAMPGGFVCSGTLKRRVDNAEIRKVAAGAQPPSTLFSKEQLGLIAARAPGAADLDEASILGPVLVLKLKFRPEDFERKMVAEVWLYPDKSRVLEISTKCAPKEAFQAAAETRVFLSGHGVDLGGEQQTKTRKALEFFASRMAAS